MCDGSIVDIQNKRIGAKAWHGVKRECVERIHFDIDGKRVFKIVGTNREELIHKYKDGRKWKTDTRTKWSGYSSVRYKECKGGLCGYLLCSM